MLGHRDAQPGRNIQSEISGEVGCAGWRGTRGMGRTRVRLVSTAIRRAGNVTVVAI